MDRQFEKAQKGIRLGLSGLNCQRSLRNELANERATPILMPGQPLNGKDTADRHRPAGPVHLYRHVAIDGHEVVSSSSYERASSHLLEENFDVVIVDQGGPYFKGREILERLHDSCSRSQILVLARHHDMRCYLASLNLGAVDYFEKPAASKDLKTAVETCLITRSAHGGSRGSFGHGPVSFV